MSDQPPTGDDIRRGNFYMTHPEMRAEHIAGKMIFNGVTQPLWLIAGLLAAILWRVW